MAQPQKVEKKEATVYDKRLVEKKIIPVAPAQPVDSETIILELVSPHIFSTSKPHKQYVNLPSNGKEEGLELSIKVKPKDLKANTAGKRVYWRVNADSNNSKRSDPKTGIKEKAGAALVEFAAGIANFDTPITSNQASIVLACGLAGGDHFTVEAGTDGENFTIKFVVENWRRLWYQLTHQKGITVPSMAITEQAWTMVYAEIKGGPLFTDGSFQFSLAELLPATKIKPLMPNDYCCYLVINGNVFGPVTPEKFSICK